MYVSECACVRACVRACVCVCVRSCEGVCMYVIPAGVSFEMTAIGSERSMK